MLPESSGFSAAAGAGILTAKVGVAALGFLMVATPIGWVGLVIGEAVVAGSVAATSIMTNNAIKENAGSWYDSIIRYVGIK